MIERTYLLVGGEIAHPNHLERVKKDGSSNCCCILLSSIILLPLPKPPRSLTRAKTLILLLGYPASMTQMMSIVLFCLGDVFSLCSVVGCLACTTYVASLLPTELCTLVVDWCVSVYVSGSTSWHIQTGKEGSCSYGVHWSEVRKCCKWLFTSRFCSHLPPSWAKNQAVEKYRISLHVCM